MESIIVAQGKKKILLRYSVSDQKVQEILDFRILQLEIEGERINPEQVVVSGEYELDLIQGILENGHVKYQVTKVKQPFTDQLELESVNYAPNEELKGLVYQEIPGVAITLLQTKGSLCEPLTTNGVLPGVEIELEVQAEIMAELRPPEMANLDKDVYLDNTFLENLKGISLLGPGIIGSYMVLYQDGKNYVFGLAQEAKKKRSAVSKKLSAEVSEKV